MANDAGSSRTLANGEDDVSLDLLLSPLLAQDASFLLPVTYDVHASTSHRRRIRWQIQDGLDYAAYFK
jgi:hypothetical protein